MEHVLKDCGIQFTQGCSLRQLCVVMKKFKQRESGREYSDGGYMEAHEFG